MFDKNPKTTPADVFVAGKTTEDVVRAIQGGTLPSGVSTDDALTALVGRFDRKAAARAAKAS